MTSVLLPLPETPVTAMNVPERHVRSTSRRLCSRAPRTDSVLPLPLPSLLRDRHRTLAAQERAGDRPRLGEDGLERAVGDDLAAVLAGPGTDVDDPVGGPDRLLVVLDDEDRVAEVAQPGQRRDELRVVALVEPDRGLVEDVQDAHQRRADLGRQPDPLGLAAGQRHARPIEGQVVEPDVHEEAEPGDDLLEQLVRRSSARARSASSPSAGRPAQGVGDRHRRDVPDVVVADRDGEDLGPEPLAAAGRARPGDHELLELGLDVVRVRLAVAALEVGDDALERRPCTCSRRARGGSGRRPSRPWLAYRTYSMRLLREVADGRRGSPSRGPRRWPRGSSAATTHRSASRAHGTSAPLARLLDRSGIDAGPGRSRAWCRGRCRPGRRRAAS